MNQNNKGLLANSFKTFESVITSVRMFWKMTLIIFIVLFAIQCSIMYYLYKQDSNWIFKGLSQKDICILRSYTAMLVKSQFNLMNKDFEMVYDCEGIRTLVYYSSYKATFERYYNNILIPRLKRNIWSLFLLTCPIYLIYFILLFLFSKKHIDSTADKYLRGKVRKSQEDMKEVLHNYDGSYKFKLNDSISIPESIVTRHNFCIGKPGSGKSQLIFKIVEQLIKRDVRCIIHDFKGDFIPAFYDDKRHYIFNPLDTRHMGLSDSKSDSPKGWTIFNELRTYVDVEAFANSIIPSGTSTDSFWYTAPRDLLKAILIYCIKNNKRTNEDVCDLIETDSEKLKSYFNSTKGCEVGSKHLADGKLAGQLMSVLSTYTSSLMYLKGTDGDFSIEKWVSEPDSKKRVIFVSNHAKVQDTLRTLISTFFDFSTKALCSLPDDMNRRLYYVLDEFGQLSRIGSIVQLLTQSRSKGGAGWILIQDVAQIETIYGRENSKSIVNSCGNKFSFAVGDESTADFISKEIGTVEIERTKESKSFGVNDLRDSISLNTEIVEKRIALPSEIMSQKSLSFFMQLTDFPLTHVDINYVKYPYNCPGFIQRDLLIMADSKPDNKPDVLEVKSNKDVDANQNMFEDDIRKIPLESDELTADITASVPGPEDPFFNEIDPVFPRDIEKVFDGGSISIGRDIEETPL